MASLARISRVVNAVACAALLTASASVEPPVAPWERRAGRGFENRGVAQIEKMGNRWVLNVMCDGTHATYLDESGRVDPARYAGRYVGARYHYVDRTITDPKCFRAPCPPVHERRIVLERVTARGR